MYVSRPSKWYTITPPQWAQYLGAIDTRRLHLAEISDSRPDRLTLVYDQSNGYTLEQKEKGLKEKLNRLQHKQVSRDGLHGPSEFPVRLDGPRAFEGGLREGKERVAVPLLAFSFFPTVTGN